MTPARPYGLGVENAREPGRSLRPKDPHTAVELDAGTVDGLVGNFAKVRNLDSAVGDASYGTVRLVLTETHSVDRGGHRA